MLTSEVTGCPMCDTARWKVIIYFGLPGLLCQNVGCSSLHGPAAWVPEWLTQLAGGEDGFAFMTYEGSYWRALWEWLTG